MDKKIIPIVVLIVVIIGAVGAYYYLKNKNTNQAAADMQSAIDAASGVANSATQGVLPSIGEAANPLTNKPDINPTSKTNPFQ